MSKLTGRIAVACLVSLLGANCGGGSETLTSSSGTGGTGGTQDPECVSGDTRECVGPGVCQGAQACNDEGTGWTTCDCGNNTGGADSSGGSSGDGGTGTAGDGGTGSAGDGGSGGGTGATGNGGSSGGTGASGGGGTGGTGASEGTGASGGSGGGISIGGSGGTGGSGGSGTCQAVNLDFVPQPPTVYVLVDQSGSIYDVQQWVPLRDAMLPMIQAAQADVRFGFGTFTGTQAMCTGLSDSGAIRLNNYTAIAAYYSGLPTTPSLNQETPGARAIAQVAELLADDAGGSGDSAILFVTADDDNDFCDNTNPDCGNDATIAALQKAAAAGIETSVFVLDSTLIANDAAWPHYWAQAGKGQQPNWPTGLEFTEYSGYVHDACHVVSPWNALWQASGKSGFAPIGNYSAAGGTAQAFVNASSSAVVSAMEDKIESLKSCKFTLEGNVSVKPGATGEVLVNQTAVPAAQWRMNSATELELLGAACATWKDPAVTQFHAGFPCSSLIIE